MMQDMPEPARHPRSGDRRLFHGVRPPSVVLARPLCCLVIDAEEDFDWSRPVHATGFSTECMRHIVDLREVLGAWHIRPTYMLTYPVFGNAEVVGILRRQLERGDCDVGIQLHPWVTPPFEADANQLSYLGALDPALEERKLLALMGKFRENFGFAPVMFRAGRYGLSSSTTGLLEQHGFRIDTSLAPRTDFSRDGGPNFSGYDCSPFWFGHGRSLLEVPLCRSVVGWGGRLSPALYRIASSTLPPHLRMPGVLSRLRCAERVTLSPEGNDIPAMRRLLRDRRAQGQTVFSLSFHSSSLAIGQNPYVRSKADLHVFYDRLSAALAMIERSGIGFARLTDLPGLLGGGVG